MLIPLSNIIRFTITAAVIDRALEKVPEEARKRIKDLNDRLTNKTKYVQYLIKYYKEHDIVELINEFEKKFKKMDQKDINQYSIEDLRNALKLTTDSKTEMKKSGAEKLFEDKELTLLKILTKEASCFYGSGAKWCISARKDNMYDHYRIGRLNSIYFILNKNLPDTDPLYKVAVTVNDEKTVYYNALDDTILESKVPGISKIKGYLKPPTGQEIIDLIIDPEKLKNGVYDGDITVHPSMVEKGKMKIPEIKEVTGNFDCSKLDLISLEGAPEKVGKNFFCGRNELTSLKGAPEKVGGKFFCSYNNLTSLENAPSTVLEGFYCYNNDLTSLKGAPISVSGDFKCQHNDLTSLKKAPTSVSGDFNCNDNELTSLEGAPSTVNGYFECEDNPGKFTEKDVRAVCDVKARIFV